MSNGSIFALILLMYGASVGMESFRVATYSPASRTSVMAHWSHPIYCFASIVGTTWAAIYIGSYSGVMAGLIAWFGLQIVSAVLSLFFLRGPMLGLHLMVGYLALSIGYGLSFATLPQGSL